MEEFEAMYGVIRLAPKRFFLEMNLPLQE